MSEVFETKNDNYFTNRSNFCDHREHALRENSCDSNSELAYRNFIVINFAKRLATKRVKSISTFRAYCRTQSANERPNARPQNTRILSVLAARRETIEKRQFKGRRLSLGARKAVSARALGVGGGSRTYLTRLSRAAEEKPVPKSAHLRD